MKRTQLRERGTRSQSQDSQGHDRPHFCAANRVHVCSQHGQDGLTPGRVFRAVHVQDRIQERDQHLDHFFIATSVLDSSCRTRRLFLLGLGHTRREALIDTALQEE